jgi:hypothetical protein
MSTPVATRRHRIYSLDRSWWMVARVALDEPTLTVRSAGRRNNVTHSSVTSIPLLLHYRPPGRHGSRVRLRPLSPTCLLPAVGPPFRIAGGGDNRRCGGQARVVRGDAFCGLPGSTSIVASAASSLAVPGRSAVALSKQAKPVCQLGLQPFVARGEADEGCQRAQFSDVVEDVIAGPTLQVVTVG